MKSNPKGGADVEEETFELQIVSLDNKQWHFEAGSAEDRDEWVQAIEQQILNSLQVHKHAEKFFFDWMSLIAKFETNVSSGQREQ